MHNIESDGQLVLAAEECPDDLFSLLHKFSNYEERVIRSLMAHGPVLLRGGRGSGKSALLREANIRLKSSEYNAFGIYISLRYLPLLRTSGAEYEEYFCKILSEEIASRLESDGVNFEFSYSKNVPEIQKSLSELAAFLQCRIVLLLDDAAHLGREGALTEFFDIFRTISSRQISCKAAIYPGVTNFGVRFDVFNDATVIDVARDESSADFAEFFHSVLQARYESLWRRFGSSINSKEVAYFLGRTVLGNMRAFVFACNRLNDMQGSIGIPEVSRCLIDLCAEYFWPLLDEVQPKLGKYEPLVDTSRDIAEKIFSMASESRSPSIIISREFCQEFNKPFEILEYAGFIAKREASRALKKGGRGPRYAMNLANLLEKVQHTKLTSELMRKWSIYDRDDISEIQKSSKIFEDIITPELIEKDLGILEKPIESIAKSKIYPYGITPARMLSLKEAGYVTVGDLANASDEKLLTVDGVADGYLKRIRNTVNQAIWM